MLITLPFLSNQLAFISLFPSNSKLVKKRSRIKFA